MAQFPQLAKFNPNLFVPDLNLAFVQEVMYVHV